MKERIAAALAEARARSRSLTDVLDDHDLCAQHSVLMSPLVWDLAHVGNYEELWLLRSVAGTPPLRAGIDDLYDAFRHPRADRPALPLLGPAETRRYVDEVRARALDSLDAAELDRPEPLLRDGFVYGLVLQHEHQHDETMLATHQLRRGEPVLGPEEPLPGGRLVAEAEVLVPGGRFVMGTSTDPWSYDNERPAHEVDVPSYLIDRHPVTNEQYAAFVAAGGYDEPSWWSDSGWGWRCEGGKRAPAFWLRDGDWWSVRRFGRVEPLRRDEPVQHVCWFEADAYARWVGKRLPTEAEWEKACAWDPHAQRARRWPWGDEPPTPDRANLGQRARRPAPVGAYPAGASAYGVEQLVGDVWEWTSSTFDGYPGFRMFPYVEYSEVFFGTGFRVLRGGSWATHALACRATFRNWDYPQRRQIFAGFRLARDVEA